MRIRIPLGLVLQGVGFLLTLVTGIILMTKHPVLLILGVIGALLLIKGDTVADYFEE